MAELSTSVFTLLLIFLAEFGDKSQLVTMTLAARYGGRSVALGAVVSFALLNLLAVTLGASIAKLVPTFWLSLATGGLFAVFGVQSLLAKPEEEQAQPSKLKYSSVFLSALLVIFIAELGDKTQLAVAGLATTHSAWQVWLGATLALTLTTLLAVIFGKVVLTKLPPQWLHKGSGVLFLLFALVIFWQVSFG